MEPRGTAAAGDPASHLTRGQVLAAWAVGFLASALAVGVVVTASNVTAYGRGVRDGVLGVVWSGILGIVPALVVGLPLWFALARALRGQRRQWVHVVVFGLAGLLLAVAVNAALFRQVLFPGGGVVDLLRLSSPWALGAALGRLAVVPWVRRRPGPPT